MVTHESKILSPAVCSGAGFAARGGACLTLSGGVSLFAQDGRVAVGRGVVGNGSVGRRSLGDVVGRTVERGDGSDFRSRVDTVCPRHFRDSCVADDHWIDCVSLDKKLV